MDLVLLETTAVPLNTSFPRILGLPLCSLLLLLLLLRPLNCRK